VAAEDSGQAMPRLQPAKCALYTGFPNRRSNRGNNPQPEACAKRQQPGFDRPTDLTRRGAAEMAHTADPFGHEDRITVQALA